MGKSKFHHSLAWEMSSDACIEQNGNSDLLNESCVSSRVFSQLCFLDMNGVKFSPTELIKCTLPKFARNAN